MGNSAVQTFPGLWLNPCSVGCNFVFKQKHKHLGTFHKCSVLIDLMKRKLILQIVLLLKQLKERNCQEILSLVVIPEIRQTTFTTNLNPPGQHLSCYCYSRYKNLIAKWHFRLNSVILPHQQSFQNINCYSYSIQKSKPNFRKDSIHKTLNYVFSLLYYLHYMIKAL